MWQNQCFTYIADVISPWGLFLHTTITAKV